VVLNRLSFIIFRWNESGACKHYVACGFVQYPMPAALDDLAGTYSSLGTDRNVDHDVALPSVPSRLFRIVITRKKRAEDSPGEARWRTSQIDWPNYLRE
jgi:hypothetical protein